MANPELDLPPDFLDLPAKRATRLVARHLLVGMGAAHKHLIDTEAEDAEALHDFRISPAPGSGPGSPPIVRTSAPCRYAQTRRQLRRIARASGAARDAEVLRTWLRRTIRRSNAFARSYTIGRTCAHGPPAPVSVSP